MHSGLIHVCQSFFCQFGILWFKTVDRMLADGYIFGNSGSMHSQPLSFKARVSIEHCIANVSIRIDCATSSTLFWLYFIIYKSKCIVNVLFDNRRIFFFYRSDGELLEESKASICTGSAINNCKSGNFGTCSGTSWSRIRSLSSLSSVTSKRVIRGHSQNLIC